MFLDHVIPRWLRRKPGQGKRIVILVHERTRRRMLRPYSIFKFTPTWIEDGHTVIVARGCDSVVPGDLVIIHVDLSVVPESYLDIARHYPVALNAGIRDIRKSAISRNLVGPESGWDGPVIVKSDLNCAGLPERHLLGIDRSRPRAWRPGEAPIHFGELDGYAVFDHLTEVPERFFSDPGLVVEKFLPEMHDGFYHIRTFHCLGDESDGYLHRSTDPLVKMKNIIGREPIAPHPDVLALRREIGLDYGKIDYVIHDGKAVILDINKTTGGGQMAETAELLAARARRARALYGYWTDAAWNR